MPPDDATAVDGLPSLGAVISTHGLAAKKSLGQNFLLDLNLTRRIARSAAPFEGDGSDQVVEIGPGPGGLTRALLLEGARRVVAIERDPRCAPALAEIAERWPGRLEVVEGDALEIDPRPYLDGGRAQIVANLPYNVGTELLVRWLRDGADVEQPPWWTRATLMFQREVADRIVAQPGSKAYGRLSVLSQWRARPEILFGVSPKAFTPPPKVSSAIVRLTPLAPPRFPASLAMLERATLAAFTQRRKMLRASLKSLGVDLDALFELSGATPTDRADAVDLETYCAIARALERLSRP